jgi:hypothetical protein
MSATTVITFPVPPYSNVPINANFYQPSVFFISAISLGVQTTVTTTVNHNYVLGQLVRLIIPWGSGSRQLNEVTGNVLSIPASNQVLLDINSSKNVDPFQTTPYHQKPQIVAVGDINSGIISTTGRNIPSTNIPGSFINISPV